MPRNEIFFKHVIQSKCQCKCKQDPANKTNVCDGEKNGFEQFTQELILTNFLKYGKVSVDLLLQGLGNS